MRKERDLEIEVDREDAQSDRLLIDDKHEAEPGQGVGAALASFAAAYSLALACTDALCPNRERNSGCGQRSARDRQENQQNG
jgi:hypothetical protein